LRDNNSKHLLNKAGNMIKLDYNRKIKKPKPVEELV